jgi:hypothetical protein
MDTLTKVQLQDVRLEDCVRQGAPVVLQTPAAWDLDALTRALRTASLTAYRFPRKSLQCARQDAEHETVTLDHFIAARADDEKDTESAHKIISNLDETAFAKLATLFPAVNDKIIQPSRRDYRNLWVNRKGDGTALHFDLPMGFNLQLLGSKTYYFFEPGTRGCYPHSWLSAKGHCSRIANIHDVDPELFPRFEGVRPRLRQVTVNQGDVTFIPSCWWHQVDSHADLNMNLTWGWIDRASALKHPRDTAAGLVTYLYRSLFFRHIY